MTESARLSNQDSTRLRRAMVKLGGYDLLRTLERRLRAAGLDLPDKPGESGRSVIMVDRDG